MHTKLIDKIINDGTTKDMEHLKDIFIEVIDDLKHKDYDEYKEVEHRLYKIVYGDNLNDELAHKWVKSMKNKDGTVGEHWSVDQTSQYAGMHHKYDWYAIMNMMYSDYYSPRFDTNTYVDLAKDWFNDKDGHHSKTLDYYLDIICD